ncbi:hypothetical protein GGTG_12247 [Gaeumannomyces tritici R3-111a-1]|uniref:Sugar phosphate transporter domain-containing protein n=1 Tax=Gaeumannomyces tritici (strain R3-111a-1) TaxID=644352 RepID=J3PFH2_GAET3|nr:hypothetical protein GGTG_12247 [Gaeumannomyces tritici R3-111a-1]EJT70074.1 hypothetical protein GGTG_12247 [Gaeumannomyces tritici R3-111a-1]
MSTEDKTRVSADEDRSGPVLPIANTPAPRSGPVPAAVYVIAWISISSSVILFNKWILDTKGFKYPVILTTYHLTFATIMTQLLARYTSLLDGRKTVKMTGHVYLRAILPIGVLFSLSLIFGNLTYLYLSVAFIQMLKATTPVAVLLASWGMGIAKPNLKVFLNVSVIVVGVVIASVGEIEFVMVGFVFQMLGVVFEALRLTMVQRLLSSAEFNMDPLVSLYYFAPVCAVMNLAVALLWELPRVSMAEVYHVGLFNFFLNGLCAFLLNVSVVMLIGKTSSLVLTICGVLKDVLLVAASMVIWQTEVSALQFFGYSVALAGMVNYKLGTEAIRGYAADAGRAWAEFGAQRPARRQLVVLASVFTLLIIVLWGMGPYAAESGAARALTSAANRVVGSSA